MSLSNITIKCILMKIEAYNAHWKFCTISKNIKILYFFVCFVVTCIYLTGKQRNKSQLLNS